MTFRSLFLNLIYQGTPSFILGFSSICIFYSTHITSKINIYFCAFIPSSIFMGSRVIYRLDQKSLKYKELFSCIEIR